MLFYYYQCLFLCSKLLEKKINYLKKNNIDIVRKSLQKNIEIYESIKECNVSEITTCGEQCDQCSGNGVIPCNYCHGTGFLTMGDIIIGTGNKCPVCMGKGEKECKQNLVYP